MNGWISYGIKNHRRALWEFLVMCIKSPLLCPPQSYNVFYITESVAVNTLAVISTMKLIIQIALRVKTTIIHKL